MRESDVPAGDVPSGGASEEPVLIAGTSAAVARRDMERVVSDLGRKFAREAPWSGMPQSKADFSWHTPSCTLENWRHTDVKVQLGPGIAHVTLNRPDDNNTLTEGIVAGLCDAVVSLHSRPDIRVVVFSGEGKLLCAGRDPKGDSYGFNVKPGDRDPQKLESEGQEALDGGAFPDGKINSGRLLQGKLWEAWAMLPQFTICLANGSAIGDGMGFVVCSDATIAIRTAFFGFSDTKVGLVSATLSPHLLSKTWASAAKNMLVLGQVLSAESAHEKGLVTRVVDGAEEARGAVAQLAAEVAKCGPGAVQAAKELVLGVAGRQVDESVMFLSMALAARASASDEAEQARAGERPWAALAIEPAR